jgi:hypothetical protein
VNTANEWEHAVALRGLKAAIDRTFPHHPEHLRIAPKAFQAAGAQSLGFES